MKLFKSLCLVLIMAFLAISITGTEYASPFSKLDRAVSEGKVDIYDAAIIKAAAIFQGTDVPDEYFVDNASVKCLTPYILEIEGLLEDAPQTYKDQYKGLKARPSFSGPEEVFISPDGYFYIHFTRDGVDAPNLTDSDSSGTPDYVEVMADAFDLSYNEYHNIIGYLTPPGDDTEGGGTDIYDIYIKNLQGTGALGYTSPEGASNDNPTYPTRRISYIVMHKNLNVAQRTSTSAHEYTHAVQFAYYYDSYYDTTRAWMENHAMYDEEVVFPDDNDWDGYVGSRQNRPYLALWTFESPSFPDSGLFPYGNVIWAFFLREYIAGYDEQFMLDLTDRMGQYTAPGDGGYYRQALDETILDYSSGAYYTATAYNIFTNWNYLVASLYDGTTYDEGDDFSRTPRVHHQIEATTDIPFYGDASPVNVNDYYTQSMGSHYNIINNTDLCGYTGISIHFLGSATLNSAWGYSVAAHDKNADWNAGWTWLEIENLTVEPFEAYINVYNLQDYDRVVLIVDNARNVEGVAGRNYEVWIDFLQDGPDASISASDITITPEIPQPGDIVNIDARIYNIGNADITNGTVNFYYSLEPGVDLQLISSTPDFGALAQGAYLDFNAVWDTAGIDPDLYIITVEIADVEPSDVNLNNNIMTAEMQLPVELSYFNAIGFGNRVNLRWQTVSEVDNLGFNLYRLNAKKVNPFVSFTPVKINDQLIQGQGTSSTPQNYSFIDHVKPGAEYFYILESVSTEGETQEWKTRLNWTM